MPAATPLSAILEQALRAATADQVEATYTGNVEAATRFANNTITQNVSRHCATLAVRVAFGRRVGRASVTDLSAESVRECVARAEALARASGEDTEFLPLPGPQSYPVVQGHDPAVAQATPETRAAGIRSALAAAREAGVTAAGSFTTTVSRFAVANNAGLYHEQPLTDTQFVLTAITADSSGWAQQSGFRLSDLDPSACAATAIRKAVAGREPHTVPPGEYTLVLEPAATMDFFGFLGYALDAKAAHEGRSAFSGLEGTRIGVPGIRLFTQPDYPVAPVLPLAEDGLPLPTTTWIADGVLETLAYSRYWSSQSGHTFTGRPANLILAGGDRSTEDLIRSVPRGILVTRFWYIRFVDPMKLLLTGMTRDGLFWIEDGEIRHGLKNMRFNESPLRSLHHITARGPEKRGGRYSPTCMPSLCVEDFRFTSGTAF